MDQKQSPSPAGTSVLVSQDPHLKEKGAGAKPSKHSAHVRNKSKSSEAAPLMPALRNTTLSMVLFAPSLDALFGEYMLKRLATDSARASDTPSIPVKCYTPNAASHPLGL